MKSLHLFIVLICLSVYLQAQNKLNKEGYQLVLFEDFENTNPKELFASGQWAPNSPWGAYLNKYKEIRIGCRSGAGCKRDLVLKFSEHNISIENGKLKLKVSRLDAWKSEEIDGNTWHYLFEGAEIHTTIREVIPDDAWQTNPENHTGWLYGLFEVDLKIPEDKMLYPSLWLVSKSGRVPEIDAFELDHANDKKYDFFSSYYYHDENGNVKNQPVYYKQKDKKIYEEFNTWSILWTPTELVYYLNGEEIRRQTEHLDFKPSSWRKCSLVIGLTPTIRKNGAYWQKNPKNFNVNNEFLIEEVRVYKMKKTSKN